MSPVSEEPGPGGALPSAPPLVVGDHLEAAAAGEAKQRENGEACLQEAPLAVAEGAGEPPLLAAVDVVPECPPGKEEAAEGRAEAPEPPEGGWGWVVMLASMWCNGAVFGIQNSCGVLFKSMLTKFGDPEDKQLMFRTAWVNSLSMGMIFFCSPIVSVFTNLYGCRKVAVIGATVAFIGLLSSSFVSYKLSNMGFWDSSWLIWILHTICSFRHTDKTPHQLTRAHCTPCEVFTFTLLMAY